MNPAVGATIIFVTTQSGWIRIVAPRGLWRRIRRLSCPAWGTYLGSETPLACCQVPEVWHLFTLQLAVQSLKWALMYLNLNFNALGDFKHYWISPRLLSEVICPGKLYNGHDRLYCGKSAARTWVFCHPETKCNLGFNFPKGSEYE